MLHFHQPYDYFFVQLNLLQLFTLIENLNLYNQDLQKTNFPGANGWN